MSLTARTLFVIIFFLLLIAASLHISTQDLYLSGDEHARRFAPGEDISFTVRLINFGMHRHVDVTLVYSILNRSGDTVYSENEIATIGTNASFTKKIYLPARLASGTYTMVTRIIYPGQQAPAVSQFQFHVEQKIFGFFQRDFFLYDAIIILISACAIWISSAAFRRIERKLIASAYGDRTKKMYEKRVKK